MPSPDHRPVAIIGAGPSGLAAARNLDRRGIAWVGFDLAHDVGGLWNINSPRSTVYSSAHLISSARTTEFTEYPMPADTPDYPDHRRLLAYFRDFADHFGLRERFRFGTEVVRAEPLGEEPDSGWRLTVRPTGSGDDDEVGPDEVVDAGEFSALVIANGTLSEPNIPEFAGEFSGEVRHTSRYKYPRELAGKRVLVVGGGNSGCDIAVDAVHHAESVDISVRRGYHFVPKYLFGKPADTLNTGRPLPARIKQAVDSRVVKLFTGDPTRFGFPAPDHKIYESHPVVNSLILQHVGHGDIGVRGDIERFDGRTVHFKAGSTGERSTGERSTGEYDLIMLATGYLLHYPFLERRHLDWADGQAAPDLYLNIFPSRRDDLAVLGMLEASGIGWQGRYEQADLLARYLAARRDPSAVGRTAAEAVDRGRRGPRPDLTGGYRYLGLDRMAYYVNKTAYRDAVTALIADMDRAIDRDMRAALAQTAQTAQTQGARS
ncbi:NAD(P)/FAD-dependent oxidoreductase [Rhodococcus sp. IEGM 1408]|uniref:flavin-containing monooxygenase n=1 Tax=Rhodococcus sp. IEGM 1408 TaxID=3082220 RepID=UPI0029556FC4|nr:NAD(P)/FAD-dependent oxidoreductase [Rhodococcus sp. IEGM 1408]MDV7999732.1 NAD(P)/FAD-dependent oxidoreductase [Rhodococcus sp. IEGM 1408]